MDRIVRGKIERWSAVAAALAIGCGALGQQIPSTDASARPSRGRELGAERQAAGDQIVVLIDGGILSGRVSRSGERYVLARDKGETFIPVSKVMLVASSLEDAYQQRRQRIVRPTADEHLVLAEWCLRHELMAHAHHELAAARALDARHDKLPMLERRLELANDRLQQHAIAKAHEPSSAESTETLTSISETSLGELPAGAIEQFTRKVQPVLVNSCTTTGCHRAGGTAGFQLDRALLRGMSNRRSTMNNLAATLALVNRDNPQLSPLLTVPRTTHGGMKAPVFGPRQEAAYRHLHDWVALVTANSAKPSSPSPASPDSNGNELPAERSDQPATGQFEQAVHQESALQEVQVDGESTVVGADENVSPQAIRYGATLNRWQPRDPFDPEIFNRMHTRAAEPSTEH
jgi:hypothetical protein